MFEIDGGVSRKKIKIVIADDHVSLRKGLIQILSETGNFKVVGEASNGRELLDILPELSPDIILLDIEMPQMNGKEALQKIIKQHPMTLPMIFSSHYSTAFMKEFIGIGARAYLPKSCDIEVLIKSIHEVYTRGFCLPTSLQDEILDDYTQQFQLSELEHMALTHKEVHVLKLICDGLSTKQMATRLKVDINTINFHKKNIYRKTHLNSIGPLVKYAIKHGYTDL